VVYGGVGIPEGYHNVMLQHSTHQGNTKSASMKLEGLGMMGVPYNHFEVLLILTVSSRHVEARRIVAEYFFSHWLVLQAPALGGVDDACTWTKHRFI
jgi:hypothetical protein